MSACGCDAQYFHVRYTLWINPSGSVDRCAHMCPQGCYAHVHMCGQCLPAVGDFGGKHPHWVWLVHTLRSAGETLLTCHSLVTIFLNEKVSKCEWLSSSREVCMLSGFSRWSPRKTSRPTARTDPTLIRGSQKPPFREKYETSKDTGDLSSCLPSTFPTH